MTPNSDELEECVAKRNRSWGCEVIREFLTIKFAADSCCVCFSETTGDLISAHVMRHTKNQENNVIDLVILKGP